MKYVVEDYSGDEVTIAQASDNMVHLMFNEAEGDYTSRLFTEAQFKEFRKAVGYVWQEVHSDGE